MSRTGLLGAGLGAVVVIAALVIFLAGGGDGNGGDTPAAADDAAAAGAGGDTNDGGGGANDGAAGDGRPQEVAAAFTEADGGVACDRCDALLQEIDRLRQPRIKALFEGAGCSLGSGSTGFTGISNWLGVNQEWNCPNQAAAESLGEAIQDAKENPSRIDEEIRDLIDLYETNCPCMQLLHQCVVCAGVQPGGLCPTHFVTSKEECDQLGGEFRETQLDEAGAGGGGS